MRNYLGIYLKRLSEPKRQGVWVTFPISPEKTRDAGYILNAAKDTYAAKVIANIPGDWDLLIGVKTKETNSDFFTAVNNLVEMAAEMQNQGCSDKVISQEVSKTISDLMHKHPEEVKLEEIQDTELDKSLTEPQM